MKSKCLRRNFSRLHASLASCRFSLLRLFCLIGCKNSHNIRYIQVCFIADRILSSVLLLCNGEEFLLEFIKVILLHEEMSFLLQEGSLVYEIIPEF